MYNPDIHHRRSVRLKGYDYSQLGCYFVTICTYERMPLFGCIADGQMTLNEYGRIAEKELHITEKARANIEIDEHIIMPNHIHCIIKINFRCRGTMLVPEKEYDAIERFAKPTSNSIPTIIRGYKSAVTKQLRDKDVEGYCVWQKGYYEHIIRNEEEFQNIKEYIKNNPNNWKKDKLFL